MNLTNDELQVLEEIIELDGSCLTAFRCKKCPFARKCLSRFVIGTSGGGKPLSKQDRINMAADTLTHMELMGGDFGSASE